MVKPSGHHVALCLFIARVIGSLQFRMATVGGCEIAERTPHCLVACITVRTDTRHGMLYYT